MANLGFTPFYNRPARCYAKKITANGNNAKTGMVVVADTTNTNASDEVKTVSSAGATGVEGVIVTPQGDPNNSNQFVTGNIVDVAYEGVVPVLVEANAAVTRGATLITSATTGCAKLLAAEAKPYDVIGYAEEDKTIGGSADFVSVRLNVLRIQS